MAIKVLREAELASFPSGRGKSTRIRLVEYENVGVRLDVRKFFTDDAGEIRPTNKGITIRAEWAQKLHEGLDRLEREAGKAGES